MSKTALWDPVQSPTEYEVSANGVRVSQTVIVTGCEATNLPAREAEAINYIGQYVGSTQLDPTICASCYLETIRAAPFVTGVPDGGIALVYTYAQRLPNQHISLFGSCEQRETTRNNRNELMTVQKDADTPETAEVVTANKYVSAPGLRVSQHETPAGGTTYERMFTILYRKSVYEGTVNSGFWMGASARKWLCLGIEAESNDNGWSYDVTYTFLYNPMTWDEHTFWRNDKGIIPSPTNSKSAKVEELYVEQNFYELPI